MAEIKGVFGWALQVEYNETVLYLEHITVFGCGGTECAGSTKGTILPDAEPGDTSESVESTRSRWN